MGSKETPARNWSFHLSQVNYISLVPLLWGRDNSIPFIGRFENLTILMKDLNFSDFTNPNVGPQGVIFCIINSGIVLRDQGLACACAWFKSPST